MDLEAVFRAAADYGCLLELNCQPERLDLDDVALLAAREHSVRIVISTDAHAAGLEARHVANPRSLRQFRKLLKH